MNILKKTKDFQLNEGNLQANGLYNVSSTDEAATKLSLWFGGGLKRKLMRMSAAKFNEACEKLCK